MKSLFTVFMSLLIAGQSFANPDLNEKKEIPSQLLLVKDENGKWTLFNGSNLLFPESEKDGFKIIQLPVKKGNSQEDPSMMGSKGADSTSTSDTGTDGGSAGGPAHGAAGSGVIANAFSKITPYLPMMGRVAAGASMIALGMKFGGLALSAGVIAGLTTVGLPFTTAIAVAGVLTMSSGSQASILGKVGTAIAMKIPFLSSWFGAAQEPDFVLPDVPMSLPSALSDRIKALRDGMDFGSEVSVPLLAD